MFCSQCGFTVNPSHRYCPGCGGQTLLASAMPGEYNQVASNYTISQPIHTAKRLDQVFGIDPRVIFLTFLVDVMLNAGEIASAGLLVPVSFMAAVVLGYITYRAQIHWYGDDREAALTKSLILALLTAIPTAIPAALYLPSGVLGLIHNLRKK